MTAIDAPYDWSMPYDNFLVALTNQLRVDIIYDPVSRQYSQDGLFVIVGDPRRGKSTLAKHIVSLYMNGENLGNGGIGLTRKQWMTVLKRVHSIYASTVKTGQVQRMYDIYDEAMIERGMSKFGRRTEEIFNKNAAMGCLHVLAYVSLQSFRPSFVKHRVHGVFLCMDGETGKPRRYAYFSKKVLEKIIVDDKLKLTNDFLKSCIKKYPVIIGRFKKYEGDLNKGYSDVKIEGMLEDVDDFIEEFGEKGTSAIKTEHDLMGAIEIAREYKLNIDRVNYIMRKMETSTEYITRLGNARKIARKDVKILINLVENRLQGGFTAPVAATPYTRANGEKNEER